LLTASNRGCAPWFSKNPLSALIGACAISGAVWAKPTVDSNKVANPLPMNGKRNARRLEKKDKKIHPGSSEQLPIVVSHGGFVERNYCKYLKIHRILFSCS